jgi:hypothetical protein
MSRCDYEIGYSAGAAYAYEQERQHYNNLRDRYEALVAAGLALERYYGECGDHETAAYRALQAALKRAQRGAVSEHEDDKAADKAERETRAELYAAVEELLDLAGGVLGWTGSRAAARRVRELMKKEGK